MTRTSALALAILGLVLAVSPGCTSQLGMRHGGPGTDDSERPPGEPGGDPLDPPAAWDLTLDTDASDRYLGLAESTGTVRGTMSASDGIDRVEIGTPTVRVVPSASGAFTSEAPLAEGLTHVEVRGFDDTGRVVRGDRAMLRASYLPEREMSPGAVAIAVSDALLAALASRALGEVSGLDLSSFLTPGMPLIDEGPCHLVADRVSHSPPTLALRSTPDGHLALTVRMTDIAVGFHGSCSLLGRTIDVDEGSEADETTVEISMVLDAIPAPPGECVAGFTATGLSVAITSFDLDLRLSGCGLLCAAGELIGEIAEGAVRGMLEDRLSGMVEDAVGPLLATLSVLDTETSLDLLETPIDLALCMTSLGPEDGHLVAGIGTRIGGPGGIDEAPGAPTLPVTRGPLAPSTLLLDPALVGQLLFSVWNAGSLRIADVTGSGGGLSLTVTTLGALVPEVRAMVARGELPAGAALSIDLDASLAPIAEPATLADGAAGVDFFVGLGDLHITVRLGTTELFVIGTTIRMGLALEPTATGGLAPTLVPSATTTTTWLISSGIDSLPATSTDRLVTLVNGLVPSQIAPLLSGAEIALPDLGVPLVVTDVSPLDGGYLQLTLAP